MELATNLFTKGLQLDTHPMVQSNDTLTDCLNGTLITMNGNEVILLNDMGNRRVDNAFLPSGYEPVGMKEYGGIIYVAAYNPITNKSQIGSFPSPEKIIDINDDENLGGEFDFDSILSYTKTVEELEDKYEGFNVEKDRYLEIPVIKSDSFLVPLTNDTSLRAGDKFTVYANGLSSLKDLLTNYNNVDVHVVKAISPKNRKYTLLLGVLNSQNEFVDITKTLCRWSSETWKILDGTNYSDLYNFNRGYFIPDEFNNEIGEYTINDAKLIKERLKIATNTYSYKLIGPLYLKVIFNHIEEFDYNIYGHKDENSNTYTITIEGYIKYNCVDSYSKPIIRNSNLYKEYCTYDEVKKVEFSAFDLWYYDNERDKKIDKYIIPEDRYVVQSESKYNPVTNLYSAKVTKTFIGIKPNKDDNKTFEYVLGVLADISKSDLYIRGLSVKNSIDLSLLGSGIVRFNGWLFLNDVKNKTTTFLFNINSYPEEGITHTDLRFEFTSVTDDSVHKLLVGDLYNGQITLENESWSSIGLEERTVYTVKAFYRKKKSDGTYDGEEFEIENGKIEGTDVTATRWLLTTELFNEFYKKSEVPDFCTTLNEEFLDKMKVYLEVSSDSVKANIQKEDDEFIGSLISKTLDISYSCKHGYNVKLSGIPELGILNEEYYPSEIKIKPSSYTIQSETPIISSVNEKLVVNDNHDTLFKNNLEIVKNSQSLNLINDNFLEYKTYDNDEIEVIFYDRYKAIGKTTNNINNIFAEMSTLNHKGGPTTGFKNFGCILLNYQYSENEKFIDVYYNLGIESIINIDDYYCIKNSHLCFVGLPSGSDTFNEKCDRIYTNDNDETLELSYGKFSENIDLVFNKGIYGGLMFMYMFPGNRVWYSNTTDMYCYDDSGNKIDYGKNAHLIVDNETYDKNDPHVIANPSYNHGAKYARVWWRTLDNGWALFKDMLNINESLTRFIKRQFNNIDYIYCMYDDYDSYKETFEGREITIYIPNNNYIYNLNYKIPIDISFKFKLNRLVEENSNILTNYEVEDIFGKELNKGDVIHLYDNENNILSNRADGISSTNEILDIPDEIKIGNLKFAESLSLDKISYILRLELVSNETFYKNINNQSNEISGIYINGDDYIILDSTGNKLISKSIYYYKDKKLIKANNLRFLMINDGRSKNGSQNILVYNVPEGTSEKLMFKYDHSGRNPSTHIMLDYSDARIVTL